MISSFTYLDAWTQSFSHFHVVAQATGDTVNAGPWRGLVIVDKTQKGLQLTHIYQSRCLEKCVNFVLGFIQSLLINYMSTEFCVVFGQDCFKIC